MQGSPVIFALTSGSMDFAMPATAIYASRILTPQEEMRDCVILVEAGRITAIGHRDEVHIPPGAKDYVASGHDCGSRFRRRAHPRRGRTRRDGR